MVKEYLKKKKILMILLKWYRMKFFDLAQRSKNKISIYISDLLPQNAEGLTTGQFIIISRILDILDYQRNNGNFEWQEFFYTLTNRNDNNINETEFRKNYFRNLLENLDREGFNDRLGRVQVCIGGGESFYPNNGTHRFAWCYVNRQLFIPVIISREKIWFSEKGKNYLKELNMPLEKIEYLEKAYSEICRNLDFGLICFIKSSCTEKICSLLKQYGKLVKNDLEEKLEYEHLNEHGIPKNIRKILKKFDVDERYDKFTLFLNEKKMYYFRNKIYCKQVEEIKKRINAIIVGKRWGWLAGSVTESKEVTPYIEKWIFFKFKK